MRAPILRWFALAVLAVAGVPPVAQAVAAVDPVGAAAGRWLAGQLVDGAMPGFSGPDWGLTIDVQWALTAVEHDPAVIGEVVGAIEKHVPDYAGPAYYPNQDARIAGATAKVLLAAVVAGKDATAFGGRNMRRETLNLIAGPDAGFEHGRLRDHATGSDDTNIFGQALAVIGLARSGGVPAEVVGFLRKQQCLAGFFRMFYNDKLSCDGASGEPDGDGTALGVQALMAARTAGVPGLDAAIQQGVKWLVSVQRPDGSYGGGASTAGPNANSTGLIAQTLAGAGHPEPGKRAAQWIRGMQLTAGNAGSGPAAADIGAIAYNGESLADAVQNGLGIGIDQWRRTTPQAVLAVAPIPFGELTGPTGPPGGRPTVTVTAPPATVTAPPATVTAAPGRGPTVTATGPVSRHTVRRPSTTRTIRSTISESTTRWLTPAGVTVPADRSVARLVGYLRAQLTGGNRIETVRGGSRYVDYDLTADLALALRQANQPTVNAIAALLSRPEHVAGYAYGVPHDEPNARYAGPLAKLVLLSAFTTKDTRLVGELVGRIQGGGRLTDQSRLGDQSTIASQAYAVLALTAVGRPEEARRATEALLRQQCGDGGFPLVFGGEERRCQTGDTASTALVVQALNAKGGSTPELALVRAVRALADRQAPDLPGLAVASTGLRSVGIDTADARARLAGALRPDGGMPVRPGTGSNRAASVAALPALAMTSFLTVDRSVLDQAATVPFPEPPDPRSAPTAVLVAADTDGWPARIAVAVALVLVGAGFGWFVARRREATR